MTATTNGNGTHDTVELLDDETQKPVDRQAQEGEVIVNYDPKPGDLIRFDTKQYGWHGVIATVTKVTQDQDGNLLVGYLTHGYHGTTTLDRIIPVCNHEEDAYA